MFPCKLCSQHFQKMLADYPIKNNSREELVYYLCDLHNKVNSRLKKPIFDCKKAFNFWGGECGCSEKKELTNENNKTNTTLTNHTENRKEVVKEVKTDNIIKADGTSAVKKLIPSKSEEKSTN